jgi:hypothetical protein
VTTASYVVKAMEIVFPQDPAIAMDLTFIVTMPTSFFPAHPFVPRNHL